MASNLVVARGGVEYVPPISLAFWRWTIVFSILLFFNFQTLVNKTMTPGTYTFNWDGKDILNSDVASGVYFYELRAESFINRKKMLLIR